MIVLLPIVIAVGLLINYVVATKFEKIAFQKGYDSSIHSLAMCFWLGIVGYLYVIALPNLNNHANVNEDNANEDTSKEDHKENISKEKYDQCLAKAERYKDTFFDRDLRISVYESIVKEMETFDGENFEDYEARLNEYRTYLQLLKTKQIK